MNHLMVDLETMSTDIEAAIVSIGAVQFDPIKGKVGETYYRVIDLASCEDFKIDGNTLYWWLGQSEYARESIREPNITLPDFADEFSKFITYCAKPNPTYMYMWGNGANFDNPIIRHIYYKLKKPFPIPFRNDRDMRTLMAFYPKNLQQEWWNNNPIKGAHNSLADAKHQVKLVCHVMKDLGVDTLC